MALRKPESRPLPMTFSPSLLSRMMKSRNLIGILIAIVVLYVFFNVKREYVFGRPHIPGYKEWKDGMMYHMTPHMGNPGKIWDSMPTIVNLCEPLIARKFNISRLINKDEAKFHIFPGDNLPRSTVLTIGVGNDVEAEKQLKKTLKDKVELFGADPIVQPNEGLYSPLGSFFPFAVGADAGMSTALVLQNGTYSEKTVVHVDFIYYLTRVIRRKFIDALWLDAENAEYDMLPMFARGGALDQNDITICQINMEIHLPDTTKKQQAHDFFYKLMEDERYIIIQAVPIGHMRVYMLNVENELCLQRYKPY